MSEVYLAISLSDGSVAHMAFQTEFRSPQGTVAREANDANIEFEIARLERGLNGTGKQVVTWRRITDEEHALFGQDRDYRNALTYGVDGSISHDMEKAKAIQTDAIRADRNAALVALDGEWMKAVGQKNQVAADAIEAQRQILRDAPADPRIAAAVTLKDLSAITVGGIVSESAIPVSPVKAG